MTEPSDEERKRIEAQADAEADRQLDAVRNALNSALEDLSGEGVHPVTIHDLTLSIIHHRRI
jgi:hypothetical protein